MTETTSPALVAVAHGSRDPRAAACVTALVDLIRARRPQLRVEQAYVEITEPAVTDVLRVVDGPTVLVPLLLAAGYHVRTDLPRMAEKSPGRTTIAAALGPDPDLVAVTAERVREAGWRTGDAVVLAAAGSSDPRAVEDTRVAGRMLSDLLATDVTTSFVSATRPSVSDAIATAKSSGASGQVFVATYLLAPGYFADSVATAAAEGGAAGCAAVLGAHATIAEVALARYDAARDSG